MATVAITGGRVLPVEGEPFEGTVLLEDGKIAALGPTVRVPRGAERVSSELAVMALPLNSMN